MILITTAGKVGSEAARQLAQRGEQVRVLVHSPDKAAALARNGIDVFQGDLEIPASLDAAMRGVTHVVLVTQPVVKQELNVIDGAARAGVEHVVKITSKASADSPIARRRNQAQIETALIASGLSYTLLRNNAYMQNFFMMAPAIAHASSFNTATGNGRVGHIDARDVAAVAAEIAASPSAHAGKTYWPTGPEVLSGTDVAAVLSKVLGRTITFQPITFDQQRQAMINAGLPEAIADDNARAVTLMAEGDCDYTTDNVPAILGRPARSFEQFATDYAAAFSSTPNTHRSAYLSHSTNEVAAPNQSRSQRAPSPLRPEIRQQKGARGPPSFVLRGGLAAAEPADVRPIARGLGGRCSQAPLRRHTSDPLDEPLIRVVALVGEPDARAQS